MDPLTHTAVGLFLSRAGMNRWTPRATPILILAANIPDCDVVAAAGGSLSYLNWHRHITHCLIAMPAMALLAVAAVRVVFRTPVRWLGAFAAAFLAVGTHLLLDLTNSYGVRIFLPFNSSWVRFDNAAFPDPYTWTILALGIAAPLLAGLVGSEISSGSFRQKSPGRAAAVFALIALAVYDGGRAVLHARAVAMLESRMVQGVSPTRVAAFATPTNPLRWRAVIETPNFYTFGYINLAQEYDPGRFAILQKPDPDPAIDAARSTATFQDFLRWSQFTWWRIMPSAQVDGAKRVDAIDLRFGSPANPGFSAHALVTSNQKVVQRSFHF
jgi:inner membrane protein